MTSPPLFKSENTAPISPVLAFAADGPGPPGPGGGGGGAGPPAGGGGGGAGAPDEGAALELLDDLEAE